MAIIRAIILLLMFFGVPAPLGRLITYRAKTTWTADYLVGFFGNMAVFYLLYCLWEFLQNWNTFTDPAIGAFSMLLKSYFFVIAILMIVWLVVDRKNLKTVPGAIKEKISSFLGRLKEDKFSIIYLVTAICIMAIQLYMAFGYEINEWSYDDYDYVVLSKDTITSDTISYVNFIDGTMPNLMEKRAVTSWMTYISMLSVASDFEVTTISHTILPVLLMLLAYLSFYYTAQFLFKKLDNRLIFMCIIEVAYMFGLYSHYSSTFRLMGALWQGKAVLSVIAVPFFILYLFRLYQQEVKTAYMFPIAVTSLGICSLTSLSIMFLSIVSVLVWLVMCVYHRKPYGIRYFIASMVGPGFLAVFYVLVWMLQRDSLSYDFKYFWFRKRTDWWNKWIQ